MLKSNYAIDMINTDPVPQYIKCLDAPCNIPAKIHPWKDFYAVFRNVDPELEFSIEVDRSEDIVVFTWEAIIIVAILATVAFVLLLLTGFFFCLYKSTPRGKGYGDLQNEGGRRDSFVQQLND